MRPSYAFWLLGLSIAGSGCALVEDAHRNLSVSLSAPIEAHREKARNLKWAEAAWQGVCMRDGPCAHSEDFAQGFKDGFVEYLFRGGDGEPPLVAPLYYRHIRYQNAKGYQAIQDWFAGYRLGAVTAQDSGARRWITGPSALQMELHEPGQAPPVVQEVARPPAPRPLPQEARLPIPVDPVKTEVMRPLEQFPPIFVVPVEPPAEPLKARIMNVREAPSVEPEPLRLRITNVSVAPQGAPDAVRLKIKTITTAPEKD